MGPGELNPQPFSYEHGALMSSAIHLARNDLVITMEIIDLMSASKPD